MSDAVWLTVKEYAALRRVHVETVRRWIRAGHLTVRRTGAKGHWQIQVLSPAIAS